MYVHYILILHVCTVLQYTIYVFCIMERIQGRPCPPPQLNSDLRRLFEPKREAMAGGWGNTIARSFVPGDLHNMLLEKWNGEGRSTPKEATWKTLG